MKNFSFILFIACCFTNSIFARNNYTTVPHVPPHRTCISKIPSIEWENDFDQKIQQFLASHNSTQRITTNYTIPVIVHVVYWNAAENISQAQVNSQIDILNADYAGTGVNSGNVPSAFASAKANTNISFCLAQKKPNGTTLTETGIDRVNAQTIGLANPSTTHWDDSYIDDNVKPATIWDPTKYMNIWVVPCIYDATSADCGTLGYATFPANSTLSGLDAGGTATTDGVVIGYYCFGNTGTAQAPYNLGRTASHEIGHWLGLRHTWGDSNCGTDYCADTPPEQTANYNCETYPYQVNGCGGTSAPNGVMFMDFMDYTDDACMYMFTNDQRTRIQTAMANGTYRAPLVNSTVCSSTPQKPVAAFTGSPTTICPGSSVTFTDISSNTPTSWSWTFTGGTPATSTSQNPTVTYASIGTYAVKLKVTNSLGSDSLTKTGYIVVANPTATALPLVQGFESTTFPPTGWNLTSLSGFNWERTTTASGFGTSTASMRFNNSTNDGGYKKDDITTPVINLSSVTNPRIKFDVAYAPYVDASGTYLDTIEVLVKNYCTGATTSVYKKGGITLETAVATGTAFVPTSTQWRKDSVNIPVAFLNNNIQVIFRNYGDFGNIMYVDNVNIYGTTTTTATATASFTASDTTVCLGSTLTFTNTSTASSGSPDSVRWTIPGGTPSTSNSTTTLVPTFNTVGTYIISLTAYTHNGTTIITSSAFTKSIRVKSKPTVTVTSPTICSGQTAQPVASGATSYTWTGGLSSTSNPTTPVLTTTTIYTVTGITSACTNTAVSTVTVNALPNVTVTSPTICSGQTAQPVASGASSFTWTGGLSSTSNPTTPVLTTTITYTVTGTTGSCSKTAVSTITVIPLPNVTVTSPGICTGSTATIQASGATSYTWTGGLASVSNPTTPTLTTTTTYTVTGTTGSCSKTAVSTVTVASSLNVTVTSPSICSGQTAQPVVNGGTTYTWTGGLTSVSNPTTPVLTTTTTYTVTGTSGSCSKTAVSTITVKPTPGTPTITQSHDTLYSNVIVVGASYEWYKGGTLLITTSTPFYKFTSNGIYTVKVINNGCSSTMSANFNAVLTGIKNNKLNVELSIIPNPNNGSFDINITSGANKTYQLKLFNLSGQILFDEEMNIRSGQNSKRINLAGIEKGAYFLSIISDDGITTQNIIVQ